MSIPVSLLGMRSLYWQKTEVLEVKTVPGIFCPPKVPQELPWD